jgi:hypothetical protein
MKNEMPTNRRWIFISAFLFSVVFWFFSVLMYSFSNSIYFKPLFWILLGGLFGAYFGYHLPWHVIKSITSTKPPIEIGSISFYNGISKCLQYVVVNENNSDCIVTVPQGIAPPCIALVNDKLVLLHHDISTKKGIGETGNIEYSNNATRFTIKQRFSTGAWYVLSCRKR